MYARNENTSYPLTETPSLAKNQMDTLKQAFMDFRFNVYGDQVPGVPLVRLAKISASRNNSQLYMYFDAFLQSEVQYDPTNLELSRYLSMDGTSFGNFSVTYSDAQNGVAQPYPGGYIAQFDSHVLLSTEAGPLKANSRAELRDSKPFQAPAEASDQLRDYSAMSLRFKGKVSTCHSAGMTLIGFYRPHLYDFNALGSSVSTRFVGGVENLVGFINWDGKWRASVCRPATPQTGQYEESAFALTEASIFEEHELEVHISDFGNRAELLIDGIVVLETSGTLPNRISDLGGGVFQKDKNVFYGAAVRCAAASINTDGSATFLDGELVQLEVRAMEAKRFSPRTQETIPLGSLKIFVDSDILVRDVFRINFDKSDFLGFSASTPQTEHPFVPPPATLYYDGYLCLSNPIPLIAAFNNLDPGLPPTQINVLMEPSTSSVFSGHRVNSVRCRNRKPLIEQQAESKYEFTSDTCTGDIRFVQGANCNISVLPATNTIVLAAQQNVNGTPEEECGAWKEKVNSKDTLCNEAIYSISGAEPDLNGDVQIKSQIPLSVSSLRAQDVVTQNAQFEASLSQFPHIIRFIYVGLPESSGNPNVLDCDRV